MITNQQYENANEELAHIKRFSEEQVDNLHDGIIGLVDAFIKAVSDYPDTNASFGMDYVRSCIIDQVSEVIDTARSELKDVFFTRIRELQDIRDRFEIQEQDRHEQSYSVASRQ